MYPNMAVTLSVDFDYSIMFSGTRWLGKEKRPISEFKNQFDQYFYPEPHTWCPTDNVLIGLDHIIDGFVAFEHFCH